jgi:ketosteroid isomerase-like protein
VAAVERDEVTRWLERYVEAWTTYDRARIADLFTEDAEYRYHPYDDPVRGREAIVESWLEEPDAPGTFEPDYSVIAVDGEVAVATGTSAYRAKDGSIDRVYDNAFVMRFDGEGRCRGFTEWYMKRPQ